MTGKGTVHADHVVNAGGLWAREVASMAGVYVPLMPMERHCIVTDDVPEIYGRDSEHPMLSIAASESDLRQEEGGL